MNIVVTDTGFGPDTWAHGFDTTHDVSPGATPKAIDITPDTDPGDLTPALATLEMIRVDFPSFADGRGFSIARRLRRLGYRGRLRARGHVLADQYAMARRCGFDEVEIDEALAARQPQDQWLARTNWTEHDYQFRLRGSVAS